MGDGVSRLQSVAEAVQQGKVKPGAPLCVEGDDVQLLLTDLSYDFACRLRDVQSPQYPNGLLLTLHRSGILPDENIEIDDIPDEAGVFLQAPDTDSLLSEPPLPIPEDVIDHIKVRVSVARLGVPEKSDYDLFLELDDARKLGFGHQEKGLIRTDNMAVATCTDGQWTDAMAVPYSKLSFSPNMQVLHYGSAMFEGMTAEWGEDGACNIFGMRDHYERMRRGAVKLGIDAPSWELFEKAIITAVQQNARFIPKNGRLYIRPHCADIGPQMRVGNSRVTGFFVEVTPIGSVGAYFGAQEVREDGVPMKVLGVPDNRVRAAENQGDIKAVGGYAQTAPVINAVRSLNVANDGEAPIYPDGVLYLDRVVEELSVDSDEFRNTRICETNASNTVFFKDLGDGRYRVIAPSLIHGDILPGNTRKLVLAKASELGWEVEERDVTFGELLDGSFCAAVNCGTAAILSSFDAVNLVHIQDDLEADEPGVTAQVRDGLITIRDQAAVNENPVPQPVEVLLQKLLDVKAGKSGEDDKARYLTRVPGLKLQSRVFFEKYKP